MTEFIAGFFLGLTLIVAIGAQNAFILKQGLRQEHIFTLVSICALSDAILIFAGVYGFNSLVDFIPAIAPIARWGGAIFLLYYGAKSFKKMLMSDEALATINNQTIPLKVAVFTCLALTWLNPHVYLDTVVLLGSISTQYSEHKNYFAIGAMLASVVFFASLGYGARFLAPFLQSPRAWRILEGLIGIIMWTIALGLLKELL